MASVGGWTVRVVVAAVFAAIAAWGVVLARRAPPPHGVSTARPVRVRDAAVAAASERGAVRLQGTLVAVPALVARSGRELAVLMVEVDTPDGDGGADSTWRRVLPARVFLSDGDSVVGVEPADVDAAFLPLLAAGALQAGGRLPPDVATQVVPGVGGLPAREGAAVRVRAIGAGAPVLAYGRLTLRDGVASLVRPSAAEPLVLTTMTFAELERELRSRHRLARLAGWSLIVVGALGVLGTIANGLRRGRAGRGARRG